MKTSVIALLDKLALRVLVVHKIRKSMFCQVEAASGKQPAQYCLNELGKYPMIADTEEHLRTAPRYT